MINEKRKKRANELNDENYEYISDNNKDINWRYRLYILFPISLYILVK
jgi:hypothetical protein